MHPRVYLAGPDVFLPQPRVHAAALKAVCRQYGLQGISPLDDLVGEPARWATLSAACRIARRNEAHIRASHAVIANLTPFRGAGADVGTVYEVGFARALGLPVFGWSMAADDHAARVRALPGSTRLHDADGLAIEDFGLPENLMVSCGIAESGGVTILGQPTGPGPDLALFRQCAAAAAAHLAGERVRVTATATP